MNGSSVRALGRIAWRDIVRYRGRSILVIALVALPVAAMVAGISVYRTTQISQERQDVGRMGRADLLAYVQSEDELQPFLPAGSIIERAVQTEGHLLIAGARPSVDLRAVNLDGLAEGMLTLVDGRAPVGVTEVAISRPVAQLAKVGIGGTITLDGRAPATVVGIVEYPLFLDSRAVLVDPRTFTAADDELVAWLVKLPDGADAEAIVDATYKPGTDIQEISLEARGPGRLASYGDDSTSGAILVLGAMALVEAALIASAAFAVSIRRRQRELGLLAATGATARQLAAMVVGEAAILGLAACLAGVVVGILGALALTPWLDELTEHRNGPLIVDASGVIGAVVVGFVAAIVAAVVPARTVARVPVLLALSGRRPSQSPARRTLWMGLAFVGLSVAMTVVGATMRNQDGTLNLLLLVGGAVIGTLGFGACSPWLLERLEGVARRLPVAGRIAFRDTARSRSRSSPIVTAVLAGLAAVIAIGAFTTSRDAESLASWSPSLHADELVISGPGAASAGADLLDAPGVLRGMQVLGLVAASGEYAFYRLPDAHDADGKLINMTDGCSNCTPGAFEPYQVSSVAAATPELLEMAHAGGGADDLRDGRAVVLTAKPMTATVMEIVVYDNDTGDATKTVTVPVRVLEVGVRGAYLPEAFLPGDVIQELGLTEARLNEQDVGSTFVLQYEHPVGDVDLSGAQQAAAHYPDTLAVTDSVPVRPGEGFRLVLIALVLLFAVSVTAIAIALGEAESRPEQRSLLALGADPRLRRRIAAARAAVLALLAGILAVPAGLLPMWGVFTSRGSPLAVPTLEIVGAVLILPLLAVASAWLLSRPIPEWNAFRNVGAGQ